MKNWIGQFKQSLKGRGAEEFFDLFFFRIFAFFIVKLVYPFPITPNHLSMTSIFTGILSAVLFAMGKVPLFLAAGILYGLTRAIDCSDGMVARLKKTGTPVGRIVDGTIDYINGIAIYFGLAIGLSKMDIDFPLSPWIMVFLAGVCFAVHSMVIDYYKNEFLAHGLGKKSSPQEDKRIFFGELEKLKGLKGKRMDRLLIKIYLKYLNVQGQKEVKTVKYDMEMYYQKNRKLMYFWTLIGSSTHIFVLMASSIMFKLEYYFIYAIIVANIWLVAMWVIQIATNRGILQDSSS